MNANLKSLLAALLCLLWLPACGPALDDEPLGDDVLAESSDELTVANDDLNGLWIATVAGQPLAERAVVESWPAVGIRLTLGQGVHQLVRTVDALTSSSASLTVLANGSGVANDTIEGTVGGATVVLKRDTVAKPPITIGFPGDRPFRSFLNEVLVPAAHRDRESYTVMKSVEFGVWLRDCELYRHGSWLRTYMKGATWSEQNSAFHNIIWAVNGIKTTPRRLTKEYKFSTAVKNNLKDPTQIGLALTTFSMYFGTAAGRSLRMQITPDSTAYFITDRPARGARIGLVVMDTPTHNPLASTFGRQLLDLGAMPPSDDPVYARTMIELLAKSDVHSAVGLSGVGRSALTDWYAVMAIEDYRGVAFGYPTLGWGYNMTNVQFYGLVVRALARPGALDAEGKPVAGQLIVGSELRPGDPSYADVLNHGGDMQEYGDMARLKTLTTQYLREKRPDLIAAVEAAFVNVVPKTQLDARARADIFHFLCAQLYDPQGRTANLKGPAADQAVTAVTALFAGLTAESAQLEAWLLTHGIAKSNLPAPKSTGF